MRNYANFVTAMWRVDEWRALRADEQHAYFLLATQANISAAGVMPLTVRRWADMAAGLTEVGLTDTLRRLQAANFVVIDEDAEELLVRSFVRHDKGYNNSKRRPAIHDAAQEIVSLPIRRALAVEFARLDLPVEWLSDSLSGPLALESGKTDQPREPVTSVIPVVDNASSQGNSLSDSQSEGISPKQRDEGCGYGPYVGTASLNPQSSSLNPSSSRSQTELLIQALTQADDDETTQMIETINIRFKPRSLSAYVKAMPTADLLDLLAEVRRIRGTKPQDLPPPCGQCGPNRQVVLADGRVGRCPRCHPLVSRSAAG